MGIIHPGAFLPRPAVPSVRQTSMTPPRFQFTIRKLMLATFWVAVGSAGLGFYLRDTGIDRFPAWMGLLLGMLCPLFALQVLLGSRSTMAIWGLWIPIVCLLYQVIIMGGG